MASTKPVQLDYLWKAHLYNGTESSNPLPSAMQVWVAVKRLKCCIHAEAVLLTLGIVRAGLPMSEMIHSASRRLAIKWRLHVELLSRYSRRSGVSTPSRPRRGQDFRKVEAPLSKVARGPVSWRIVRYTSSLLKWKATYRQSGNSLRTAKFSPFDLATRY